MTDALTTTPARYLKAAADGHLGHMIEGHELAAFEGFFDGSKLVGAFNEEDAEQREAGWNRARAVCYAQGVLQRVKDGSTYPTDNPYPQFSPAWEAWAEGYDDHAAGALG